MELSYLFNILSVSADALKALLGNFIGLLLNALDSIDIFNNECYSAGETFFRALAFFYMATVLGLLFSYGVAGLYWPIIAAAMLYYTLIVMTLKDAFMRCPVKEL